MAIHATFVFLCLFFSPCRLSYLSINLYLSVYFIFSFLLSSLLRFSVPNTIYLYSYPLSCIHTVSRRCTAIALKTALYFVIFIVPLLLLHASPSAIHANCFLFFSYNHLLET